MTDKRTPMNAFRPKAQTALVLALSLFMAACSNNPLMRTSAATRLPSAVLWPSILGWLLLLLLRRPVGRGASLP